MHAWSLAAEAYSQDVVVNLKQDGDHPIQLFLRTASDIMALRELGKDVPSAMESLHAERRVAAQPYLKGGNP